MEGLGALDIVLARHQVAQAGSLVCPSKAVSYRRITDLFDHPKRRRQRSAIRVLQVQLQVCRKFVDGSQIAGTKLKFRDLWRISRRGSILRTYIYIIYIHIIIMRIMVVQLDLRHRDEEKRVSEDKIVIRTCMLLRSFEIIHEVIFNFQIESRAGLKFLFPAFPNSAIA
jgi:hypothetical protein